MELSHHRMTSMKTRMIAALVWEMHDVLVRMRQYHNRAFLAWSISCPKLGTGMVLVGTLIRPENMKLSICVHHRHCNDVMTCLCLLEFVDYQCISILCLESMYNTRKMYQTKNKEGDGEMRPDCASSGFDDNCVRIY